MPSNSCSCHEKLFGTELFCPAAMVLGALLVDRYRLTHRLWTCRPLVQT